MNELIKYLENTYYSIKGHIIKNKIVNLKKSLRNLEGEDISVACANRVSIEYKIKNLENKLSLIRVYTPKYIIKNEIFMLNEDLNNLRGTDISVACANRVSIEYKRKDLLRKLGENKDAD
jgi:hypothetical protein